jgi:catalase
MERNMIQRVVGALEKHTATAPGYRRAHARGIHYHAEFVPSAEVAGLTTAEHLCATAPVPTLVRLSNAAGNPHAPDRPRGRKGAVTGLAVRFDLPSGGHSTWAAASIAGFPARSPDDFIQVVKAQRPTGKPSPARLLWYGLTHRYAVPALKGLAAVRSPASFATTRYNGLHAYYLVAADGTRRAFRYHWQPEAGVEPLSSPAVPAQYLVDEIAQRVAAGPVRWRLVFQLADPGDPTDDITRQWPDDRQTVDAGLLTLTRLHEDQAAVANIVFDPANVVPGIELSADPILHFRSQAYGESYRRRTAEAQPATRPADF